MSLTIYPDDTSSGGGTIGGLVTGGTQGSVLFVGAGGVLAQDNANFFYDDSTNQLRLSNGTKSAPAYSFAGESSLGLFSVTAATLGIASGGNYAFDFNNAGRFRIGVGGQLAISGSGLDAVDVDVGFGRVDAGIAKITNGSTGAGALEFLEQTAPSAATANSVRIYAQDNGGGKTQLMARFATGVAQQISIEP